MQLWLQQNNQDEDEQSMHGEIWAVLIGILIFGSIWAILRPRGPRVCAMACLYVASLVAIALVMRALTRPPLLYRFPGCITLLHYLCTWLVCILYWLARGEPQRLSPTSVGTVRRYLARMVPIALALPISIALNNKALVYIGAGLAAIVGTLSPVCTAILSRFFGRRLSTISWFGVMVAFGGAFWAGWTELRVIIHKESQFNTQNMSQGLAFALGALAMRSVRVVMQDSLLSPLAYAVSRMEKAEPAISGLHLLAAQSPLVVVVALCFALLTERFADAIRTITAPIAVLLAVTCAIAVLLNVLGACVLKELGSTSMQIIGKLNSIVTTAVSMAFFSERLPMPVLFGSGVVLLGVAIFEIGEHSAPSSAEQPTGKLA
mmetsp:Transcript_90383/g.264463  ORF Transcript_90383/g.264463 Transcript_90383/m.264463 type:complete len:376 (-) Transcript_90383:125-1252(-)